MHVNCDLEQLCERVKAMDCAYDDVAELIEDRTYAECEKEEFAHAAGCISGLAVFFESLENKNEEVCRDLSDVCVLCGEIALQARQLEKSREWLEKAVVVDDSYDVACHALACVCLRQGDVQSALRAWEQEIRMAPGNYYTYLLLADQYEKLRMHGRFVEVLEQLLSRDTHNIRALHRLIRHHETHNPRLDASLLRRRIINADHGLVKNELVIWTYHMCMERRHEDALHFLISHGQSATGISIVRLLKAHIFGALRRFSDRKRELLLFKKLCHGNTETIQNKLDEFALIFGAKACDRLSSQLMLDRPAHFPPAESVEGTGQAE